MRIMKSAIICLLTISILIVGCSKKEVPTDVKDEQRTLTFALPTEIKTMDLYAH
ncbi:MAG: hypothetical protein K0Q73_6271, partial [Paenibacillus sp.]|nr:hypothetical protein [Paenibacillus sp.]